MLAKATKSLWLPQGPYPHPTVLFGCVSKQRRKNVNNKDFVKIGDKFSKIFNYDYFFKPHQRPTYKFKVGPEVFSYLIYDS